MGYGLLVMKSLLVLSSMVLSVVVVAAGAEPPRRVPAMYVFGDSTLDVGNNNHLEGEKVPRANKPYYGIDLPGSAGTAGKPTGRFSNGYNVADFVAKNLGFEKSPLAYLVLKARNYLIPSAINRGVSYASAGAGILDSTNAGGNIPLSQQVRFFESTKATMESSKMMDPAAVSDHVSKSFFLVGVGSNDLFAFTTALAKQNKTATQSDVAAFYGSLISNFSSAITDLYKLGARKFGIINLGPVGCVPIVRVLNATGGCADGLNQLAAGSDGFLDSLMAGLAKKLPGLAYSIADSFRLSARSDPLALGFVSLDSACCGDGRLGAEANCLPGANLCADRDRFLYWDRVHPSQRAAMLAAQAYFDGPAEFTAPISFKQLAEYKC